MNFTREEYEKILHLLLKYCEQNQYHLINFYANSSLSKYFLISQSDDLNVIRAKYENRMIFTKEMINDDFFSSYSPNQRIPMFKVDCETGLKRNNIYSELMVECLWTYDKGLFKKIHQYLQSWSEFNQFQYDAAIVYKNKDYPKGFADQNVALYSYNKNLHHIIELTEDDFKSYFNDVWNIETFRSIYPQSCTINPLPILKSLHFQDLGYDEQFTLSKFIMEVYGVGGCFENDNILRSFGRKIEALNSLLRDIDADNLIVEDKDVVLKSLKIKKDDLCHILAIMICYQEIRLRWPS